MTNNTQRARELAEEVLRRDDSSLIEALLADAILRLADDIDPLREASKRSNALPDPAAWFR